VTVISQDHRADPPAPVLDEGDDLATLLGRSALGEVAAFARVYDMVSPRVFGLLLHLLDERPTAERLLQEVFVDLWSRASALGASGSAALDGVLALAHRRAVAELRARRAGLGADAPGAPEWTIPLSDALDDHQHRVVRLAYEDGRTQGEIAALTSTSVGSVRATTRAALTAMSTTAPAAF